MRSSPWILFGILLVGCQGQSVPDAVSKKASVPLRNEPMPKELAALLEVSDYDEALAKVNKLIEQRSRDWMLYSVRSSIHHRNSHSDAAISDLDQAIELNQSDARLYNNRGFIMLGMQMYSSAMSDFDQATELTPEYANPFNNRGLLMIAQSRYAAAIEQLDQALRLDPNYVDAYNNRGFAALQAGNVERALADFNTALRLNPRYVNAFNNRGLLRARVGDLDNAILDFTDAMVIDPMNPKYYEHRREVYLRKKAIDLALADEVRHDWLMRLIDLNALVNDDPADATRLVERAQHYLSVHDHDRAEKDLEKAIKMDSDLAPALLERGRILAARRDFKGALADASRVLQLSPQQGQEAHSLMGDAYLGMRNYDKAIENYSEARQIDASVAEAYYGKSQILEAAGHYEEAAECLKKAATFNPALLAGPVEESQQDKLVPAPESDAERIADLVKHGRGCLNKKEFKEALADAQRILDIAPVEEGYSLSGDAYLGLKEFDKAIECYAKVRHSEAFDVAETARKSQIQQASARQDDSKTSVQQASITDGSGRVFSGKTRPKNASPEELKEIEKQLDAQQQLQDLTDAARALLMRKEFDDALDCCVELHWFSHQVAYSIEGDAYIGMGKFDKALDCSAKILKLAAGPDAYVIAGNAYLGMKKFEKALDCSLKLHEMAQDDAAYSLAGDAYLGLKKFDDAIECYAKARRIDAAVAEAYFRKSQALKLSGDDRQAATALKLAKSLDPEVANRLR